MFQLLVSNSGLKNLLFKDLYMEICFFQGWILLKSRPDTNLVLHLHSLLRQDLQFQDNDLGPLLANGRCARARCHPEVLHSAFAQGAKILSMPAEDLDVEDWEVYLTFLEVSFLRCQFLSGRQSACNTKATKESSCSNMPCCWNIGCNPYW